MIVLSKTHDKLKKDFEELKTQHLLMANKLEKLKNDALLHGKVSDELWRVKNDNIKLCRKIESIERDNDILNNDVFHNNHILEKQSKYLDRALKAEKMVFDLNIDLRRISEMNHILADDKNRLCGDVSKIKRECNYLIELNNRYKVKKDLFGQKIASISGKLGASIKKVNNLLVLCEKNKHFIGRFYWPSTIYCTIKPQPIL